jgi:hypothetical protein
VNARRIVSYKRQEDGEWLIARQMWNLKPNSGDFGAGEAGPSGTTPCHHIAGVLLETPRAHYGQYLQHP